MFLKSTYISCAGFKRPPPATVEDFINVLKGDISHLFPFALLLLSLRRDPLHPRLPKTDVSLFISIPGAGMHDAVDSHNAHNEMDDRVQAEDCKLVFRPWM